tara:strand:- start:527 stop:1159 length:633 start_codon:yes stop_codon:yes gene_type:complete
MQYVPESKLKENEIETRDILDNVSIKYLNRDVKGIIESYHNPYMSPYIGDINQFWLNLGSEVCNLNRWGWYCFDRLQRSFGKTSKICKYLDYENDFYKLRHHLDKMVSNSYPNQHMINNIDIIHVFYMNTISEYPLKGPFIKHKITSQDKDYILTFLTRLNECLDFIQNNLANIGTKYCSDSRKSILKTIKKMKTRLSKPNIINDIDIII